MYRFQLKVLEKLEKESPKKHPSQFIREENQNSKQDFRHVFMNKSSRPQLNMTMSPSFDKQSSADRSMVPYSIAMTDPDANNNRYILYSPNTQNRRKKHQLRPLAHSIDVGNSIRNPQLYQSYQNKPTSIGLNKDLAMHHEPSNASLVSDNENSLYKSSFFQRLKTLEHSNQIKFKNKTYRIQRMEKFQSMNEMDFPANLSLYTKGVKQMNRTATRVPSLSPESPNETNQNKLKDKLINMPSLNDFSKISSERFPKINPNVGRQNPFPLRKNQLRQNTRNRALHDKKDRLFNTNEESQDSLNNLSFQERSEMITNKIYEKVPVSNPTISNPKQKPNQGRYQLDQVPQ